MKRYKVNLADKPRISRKGDVATLTLTGEVDVFGANAVRCLVDRILDEGWAREIQLDLSDVTRLDIAAWQVVTSIGHDVTASGRGFNVIEEKSELADLAESVLR
jgi:anti-anti-sigma regulatory factor